MIFEAERTWIQILFLKLNRYESFGLPKFTET